MINALSIGAAALPTNTAATRGPAYVRGIPARIWVDALARRRRRNG